MSRTSYIWIHCQQVAVYQHSIHVLCSARTEPGTIVCQAQITNAPLQQDNCYSSKTTTIRIRHPNLCHPSCKHLVKHRFNVLAHLFGPVFPQTLRHSDSASCFKAACSVTISKLFFTAVHAYPLVWHVCVCVWGGGGVVVVVVVVVCVCLGGGGCECVLVLL